MSGQLCKRPVECALCLADELDGLAPLLVFNFRQPKVCELMPRVFLLLPPLVWGPQRANRTLLVSLASFSYRCRFRAQFWFRTRIAVRAGRQRQGVSAQNQFCLGLHGSRAQAALPRPGRAALSQVLCLELWGLQHARAARYPPEISSFFLAVISCSGGSGAMRKFKPQLTPLPKEPQASG